MGWFSDQVKERKANNQKAFENSFMDLAGVNDESAIATRDDFIIKQLIKYFDCPNFNLPDGLKTLDNKLDYTLKTTGVLSRKIELTDSWNLDNRDPILVFTKNNKIPILMIPRGQRGYYSVSYVTGKRYKNTSAISKKLRKEAYAFYKPLPTKKMTVKEYLSFFKKSIHPLDLITVIVAALVATSISMLSPYIMEKMTGDVVNNKDIRLYIMMTVFLVSAGIASVLIKAAQTLINARVGIKFEKMMQETTMMRMLSLKPSFFKNNSTGALTAKFNNVLSLSDLIFNGLFLSILSSVMSLGFMVQIVQFAPSLILPVTAILLVNILFSVFIALMQIKYSREGLLFGAKESGTTYSMINGIQKIRLAGAEKRAFARWAKDFSKWGEPVYHPPLVIRLAPVISILISALGWLIIYFVAAESKVPVSSYVAFTSSFASLSVMVVTVTNLFTVFAKIGPILDVTKPILEEETEDDESKERIEDLTGNIKFDHVSFKYEENGPEILKDLSLEIKPGEYLGMVGKTGCGKSTLVRLLLGFEKPTSGNIYYDEKDLNNINLPSLRSKIGSVIQNGGIFHADIVSNILITAPHLKEKDAWEAAEIAGIADDIRNMPMGMQTMITEGQGGISGGQKQRIMIARAIVNHPKILIFDEATSALDNKTQKHVSEAISTLNCTRIVIAHRLSTIKHCDRIIYMENGNIQESGTYDELIAKEGKFFELVERQRLDTDTKK